MIDADEPHNHEQRRWSRALYMLSSVKQYRVTGGEAGH
jgi:hypothetical protein